MKKKKFIKKAISAITALAFAVSPIYTYASVIPEDILNSKNNLLSGGSQDIYDVMILKRNYIVISSEMEAVTIETSAPIETTSATTAVATTTTPLATTTTPPITTTAPPETTTAVTTTTNPNYSYASTVINNVEHLYKGIDVSKYQGDIDWAKVKASGMVDFAILRAGHATKDVKFESYYKSCKEQGIPVGAYWYCTATTTAGVRTEAQLFLETLEGKQFEFPVYLDMEEPAQEKLSRQTVTNLAITFCEILQNEGYYVGIYSNLNWFKNIYYTNQLAEYDKWLAQWRVPQPSYGNSFGGMWQYGSVGTVQEYLSGSALMVGKIPGIDVPCDVDLCYRDYPTIIKEAGLNGF